MRQWLRAYSSFWTERVDGASLSLFRIAFGTFLFADAIFFAHAAPTDFAQGAVIFHRAGFEWWPWHSVAATQAILCVMALGGAFVAVGLWVRLGFVLAIFGIAQLLLRDGSFFLNHLALCLLMCFAGLFLPMSRRYAVQLKLRVMAGGAASTDATIARHELFVMVLLFWASYFFGGLAKIRPEWIDGYSIRALFLGSAHRDLLGRLLLQAAPAQLWAYNGLLIDLLAPFGFAMKRTRWPTAAIVFSFHLLNHQLFKIGLFSYLMVAGMVLYFDPDWPERVWAFLRPRALVSVPELGARPPVFLLLVSVALFLAVVRQFILVPHPDQTRVGEFLGWRWQSGLYYACSTRFARATGEILGERPQDDAQMGDHSTRIDQDVAAIWSEARFNLCPSWGHVYVRWVCPEHWLGQRIVEGVERKSDSTEIPDLRGDSGARPRSAILSPPTQPHTRYGIDPDQDLCQADYAWGGANAWIWR